MGFVSTFIKVLSMEYIVGSSQAMTMMKILLKISFDLVSYDQPSLRV